MLTVSILYQHFFNFINIYHYTWIYTVWTHCSSHLCCGRLVPTGSSPGLWSSFPSLLDSVPEVRTCPATSFSETRSQSTGRCHQSYGSCRCLRSERGRKRCQGPRHKKLDLFTDGSRGGLPWRIVCRCTCHSRCQFCVSCWRVWDLGREKCDGSISSSWRSTGTHPDGSAGPVPSDSPAQHEQINTTSISHAWSTTLSHYWSKSDLQIRPTFMHLADAFIQIDLHYIQGIFQCLWY